MNVTRRIYLSRIVEKIDNNKNFADKMGLKNKSKIQIKEAKNLELSIKWNIVCFRNVLDKKRRRNVRIIIYDMYVRSIWKIVDVWNKNCLGNIKNIAYGFTSSNSIDRNGGWRIIVFGIPYFNFRRNCLFGENTSLIVGRKLPFLKEK